MKVEKTNAVRLLDKINAEYSLAEYDAQEGFLDGVSVAKATGKEIERVFKTLVTQGTSSNYYVCCIPVAEELDLKKAAKFFGEKKIEMIHAREVKSVTGYIRGGCSPIGMSKTYPTAIDVTAENIEKICVSGGKVGLQIEIEPHKLAELVGARFTGLTKRV